MFLFFIIISPQEVGFLFVRDIVIVAGTTETNSNIKNFRKKMLFYIEYCTSS